MEGRSAPRGMAECSSLSSSSCTALPGFALLCFLCVPGIKQLWPLYWLVLCDCVPRVQVSSEPKKRVPSLSGTGVIGGCGLLDGAGS